MKNIQSIILALIIMYIPMQGLAQSCNANIPLSTANTRFSISSTDGTVMDNLTGLVWMRCSIGQVWDPATSNCTGSATDHNWGPALVAADSQTFAGQSDWRLPNIKELASIVERACDSPSINEFVFPSLPATFSDVIYWTSSPYAISNVAAGSSWIVEFQIGADDFHPVTLNAKVRLVRAGL